ncbi:MAG: insulinase family protein [Anaerolineae bacterium]|nr:insulinase family protein [Anaerolineae bacterium]
MFVERTLPNGMRAVAIGRPGTATVASKLFLKAGSRHDGDRHGISHCLEHALFRGTATRSSREVYGAIEDLGGRIQAETVKDYLAMSAVTGAQHYRTGLEVLADLLLNPRFDPVAFQAEKFVILEEMARRADMRQIIWDLYDLTLWQAHPLRHRVLGYESAVVALTVDDVAAHYRRFCVPPGIVLVVCGDCDPAEALEEVERLYGQFTGQPPELEPVPAEPPLAEMRTSTLERATRQVHVVIGWPAVGLRHPDSYVLKVIDRLLGVGGRSRLYRELRERRSLVYAVQSVRAEHEDTGHLAIYLAADPARMQEVVEAIMSEIRRLQVEPVGKGELQAAQTNYEGSLAVSFETNLSLAGIVGLETLLTGEFQPFAEAARRVRGVTPEDVLRVANAYLDTERYALAMVGPLGDESRS